MHTISNIELIANSFNKLAERFENRNTYCFTETPIEHMRSKGVDIDALAKNVMANSEQEILSDRVEAEIIFLNFLLPYLIGNSGSLLESHLFASKFAVAEYSRSVAYSLLARNNLVSALCLRALIEKLSQIHYVSKTLSQRTAPKTGNISSIDIEELQDDARRNITNIKEGFSGVRFNWGKASYFGSVELTEKQRKKKLDSVRSANDSKSESISVMKMIDGMNKEIKTVRSAYDVLSEFTHPNLMQSLSYDKGIPKACNFSGLEVGPWRRTITNSLPSAPISGFERVMVDLKNTISALIDSFESHSKNVDKYVSIFKKNDRKLIRASIKQSKMYCVKDPCPCGGTLRIGQCCGKKLHNLMIDEKERGEIFDFL